MSQIHVYLVILVISKIDFLISQNKCSNNKWLWMRKSCIFSDIMKSIIWFLFCDHKFNFCDIRKQTWLCDITKSNLCLSQTDSFVFRYCTFELAISQNLSHFVISQYVLSKPPVCDTRYFFFQRKTVFHNFIPDTILTPDLLWLE